jgi:hypothetical protein
MAFVKGQSGNPRGRAKSDFVLAAQCQKFTPEVVEFMTKVLRGEAVKRSTKKIGSKGKLVHTFDTPTFQDRIRAAEWLVDRGWGKAATVLAGPGGVGPSEIIVRLETPMPPIAS